METHNKINMEKKEKLELKNIIGRGLAIDINKVRNEH